MKFINVRSLGPGCLEVTMNRRTFFHYKHKLENRDPVGLKKVVQLLEGVARRCTNKTDLFVEVEDGKKIPKCLQST